MSRTRVVARLLTGLLASAAVLVGPGTAAAHDQLATSEPAAGATVTTAPERIELEFGQAPQPLGAEVAVTGPDGVPVSLGTPRVSGTTVTQPLEDGLPAGAYTVEWRVISGDGHSISGSLGFITAEGAAAPAAMGDVAEASTSGDTRPPVVGLAVAGIVLVGGLLVVRQLRASA